MNEILVESGALSPEEAAIVVEMTKEHTVVFGATEDFTVTQEFRKMAPMEQRLSLLDCLFAVSAADRKVSTHEEQSIRKIANELHIPHEDYIDVRLRYREHLSVLQDDDKSN